MELIKVSKTDKKLTGTIHLDGSKSISNRVLIIRALCKEDFKISHLSTSDDSKTLETLLSSNQDVYDCHHAGTTFRFLTAYLAIQAGSQVLTGSDRMKQRPIGALVEALNALGCNIRYLEKEGYPPLQINAPDALMKTEVSLRADISSQFISAILMIAPILKQGLTIHLEGQLVSRPYLQMTLDTMAYFGIQHEWKSGQKIYIEPQKYKAQDITIEGDWSAASYYYAMAVLSEEVDFTLKGLSAESLQGDQAILEIAGKFGITSTFNGNEVKLQKTEKYSRQHLEYNFIESPDIAQSVSVMLSGIGVPGLFSGLKTLRIKETDRIEALQNELKKFNVAFHKLPAHFSKKSEIEYYMQEGQAKQTDADTHIATYQDHRMAMSFAPLAILFPIKIQNANVVSKSYPQFWSDLTSIGFLISEVK